MVQTSSRWVRGAGVGLLASLLCAGCASGPPDAMNGGFDFTTQAFTFTNFDDAQGGGDFTPALAARMFGDAKVCAKGAGADCVPNDAAKAWIAEANATLHHGHSEGMAVLALLMSLGKVDPATFGGSNAAALSFDDRRLRAELAYWAITQKILSTHASDKRLAPKDAIAFLADAFKKKDEGWRLLLSMRDESGFHAGHAVVPFGYFKGDGANQYFLRLYDPNFPGEERRLELDLKANTWSYEGSPNPDAPRTYVGNADNPLQFSPVTARLGVLVPPFSDGFTASTTQGVVLVEGDGTSVGVKDGQLVENGGLVMPGAADCFCKPPNGITNVMLSSGSGAKTVTVGADAGTIFATSPTVVAKVEGSGGSGGVTVDPDKKTVTYSATGDAGTTITTTTKNADGSETTVTVTVDKPAAGVTVDASDPKNVKVTADTTSSGTGVTVTTTTTQADGTQSSTTTKGTTTGTSDATITVDTTTGTSTVDTQTKVSTCLNGKKDPLEADVDCGDFCAMQPAGDRSGDGRCDVAKVCAKNADCTPPMGSAAGECFQTKCVEQTCSDGRLNRTETSVDCGGGCPCAAGFSCADVSGCRPGNDCLAQTCRTLQSLPLTIVGLGADSFLRIYSARDGKPETFVDLYGVSGGAAFTRSFQAVESFSARVISDSHAICTFDTADGQGRWNWSLGDAGTPGGNTLRCTRVKSNIGYTTNGTGCPVELEVTKPTDSIRAWERFPQGPTLSVFATSAGIELSSGSPSTDVRRSTLPALWQTVSRASDGGFYDGGAAWALSLGASVEGDSTYQYNVNPAVGAQLGLKPHRYRFSCTLASPATGPLTAADVTAQLACTCLDVTDGGSTMVDGGQLDSGVADSGVSDAGPTGCTRDTDCVAAADCYCGASSGNCTGGTGTCGAGKAVFKVPTTDGVAPSGAFTVPTGCNQVFVQAWGAAGGPGVVPGGGGPPLTMEGGTGGFLHGTLTTTPTEVFTVWVGAAGAVQYQSTNTTGIGSLLGVIAKGGQGDGLFNQNSGGVGGGLTSIKHAQGNGTLITSLTIPGGGGGGAMGLGSAAGSSSSGGWTSAGGQSAGASSTAGGGGAGFDGGVAGTNGLGGEGGSVGPLPSGFVHDVATNTSAPGSGAWDNSQSCGGAGSSSAGTSQNGCVVLRCVP
ncbi:MAG: hypothetical protein K1X89_08490 [Myxococcaceae bacterium]|nr:hypothetical protein [Myxococcaceae bacterium]